MVKDSAERTELMILKGSDSTGISTTFFIAKSKNKYCYTTGETAGSPLTYTSIMLWPVALDSKITSYSVNNTAYQHIKSKDTLEYQTEYTQIFYHSFVMYLFSCKKANKKASLFTKFITDAQFKIIHTLNKYQQIIPACKTDVYKNTFSYLYDPVANCFSHETILPTLLVRLLRAWVWCHKSFCQTVRVLCYF